MTNLKPAIVRNQIYSLRSRLVRDMEDAGMIKATIVGMVLDGPFRAFHDSIHDLDPLKQDWEASEDLWGWGVRPFPRH